MAYRDWGVSARIDNVLVVGPTILVDQQILFIVGMWVCGPTLFWASGSCGDIILNVPTQLDAVLGGSTISSSGAVFYQAALSISQLGSTISRRRRFLFVQPGSTTLRCRPADGSDKL